MRWQNFMQLYTYEISRGVLFVLIATPPPLHTKLRILFRLPDGEELSLSGKVVDVLSPRQAARQRTRAGFRIEFRDLGRAERSRFESVVEVARNSVEKQAPVPKDSSAQGVTKNEEALLTELRSELNGLAGKEPHAVLGIDRRADRSTVSTAFFRLGKRYHPDSYVKYKSPAIKEIATQLFVLIKDAHDHCIKPPHRGRSVKKRR